MIDRIILRILLPRLIQSFSSSSRNGIAFSFANVINPKAATLIRVFVMIVATPRREALTGILVSRFENGRTQYDLAQPGRVHIDELSCEIPSR